MTIAQNKVVSIDYTLTNNAGEVLDSSQGRGPLEFIFGTGQIIPGLEEALLGKVKGDKFQVNISPEKAYGVRNDAMMQEIPRTQFPPEQNVEVGMEFHAQSPQGTIMVTIAKIEGDVITIDGNHPLAGVALNFDVEVVNVAEMTEKNSASDSSCGCGCNGH